MVTVSPQNFFRIGIGFYLSRPPIIYCYGTHPQTGELSASLNESTKALQALNITTSVGPATLECIVYQPFQVIEIS